MHSISPPMGWKAPTEPDERSQHQMTDRQDEFVAKHTDVLVLRKKADELRYELQLIDMRLKDAERESSVMFHNLFNANKSKA